MAERMAQLVDHVLPDVPVRQWVLTLPHTLRYQMAWEHARCRAVVGALLRAVTGALFGVGPELPVWRPDAAALWR